MLPEIRWPSPESFPQLETERLVLRAPADADIPLIYQWYAQEPVMQYRGAPVFTQIEEAGKLVGSWNDAFRNGSGIRWVISLKTNGNACGTVGLNKIMREHFRAETGYEIEPSRWNKGLMTEALGAVAEWCFMEAGFHSLEANVAPDNAASRRVLEKLGFVQEAHFRQNWWFNGWWDSVIYSKINSSVAKK